MNNNNSVRNNQAFSKEYIAQDKSVLDTISEWFDRELAIIPVLDYIIKSTAIYGVNSHPSQTTIGFHAGIKRGWTNVLTTRLVDLKLIEKTRVIIDGDEQACEYKLTNLLKDPVVSWKLKDMLPSLKLLQLFRRTKAAPQSDCTPYMVIYFKELTKIVITKFKSISRKQKSKNLKMQKRIQEQKTLKENKFYQSRNDLYVKQQKLQDEQYKKEQEDKLMAASQDTDFVNFFQGLFNGNI